jgi:hypothetical protein
MVIVCLGMRANQAQNRGGDFIVTHETRDVQFRQYVASVFVTGIGGAPDDRADFLVRFRIVPQADGLQPANEVGLPFEASDDVRHENFAAPSARAKSWHVLCGDAR